MNTPFKLTLHHFILFISFIFIVLLSVYVQYSVLLSWDVSWGLHESQTLLAGGKYGKEIFEASPPMFLYLYAPVVWLTSLTHLHIATTLRLYLYLLSFLSWYFSAISLKKIFATNKPLLTILLIAVLGAYLLLPLPYDVGQREHLLFVLTLPYFLLMIAYLQNENSISQSHKVLIGILAGLGFAIKPFFILPFVMVECFYAYQKKSWFAWLRSDAIMILTIVLCHTLIILFFHPNYFATIVPFFLQFYYQGYQSDWMSVMFHPAILFCEFAILFFISELMTNPYKNFSIVMLFAMIGFAIIHMMQRTFWYYHLYPAFSFSMLLVIQLFCSFAVRQKNKYDYAAILVLSFFIYLLLFANTPDFYISLVGFRLITGLFFMSVISLITYLLLTQTQSFSFHTIAIIFFFGITTFVFPYHLAHTRYLIALNYKKNMQPLIQFLTNYAEKKPVYFFTIAMCIEFPAVDYAKAIPASRFPALIWLPGLLNQTQQTLDFTQMPKLAKTNQYFIDSVTAEIMQKKPVYIFVDTLPGMYLKKPFHYLNYFLTDPAFQTAWKSYRYLTTLDGGDYFRFNVYQRI